MISRWPFYGYCVYDNEVCNGHNDCKDGSDELNCQVSTFPLLTVSTERKYTLAAKPSTQNRGGLEEK